MKQTLWTRNFTRITAATTLGPPAASSVNSPCPFWSLTRQASTLASALVVAIQLIPMVLLPLVVAPMMDRLPRKPLSGVGRPAQRLVLRRGRTVPAAQCFLPTPPIWPFPCWYRALRPSMSWPTTASTPAAAGGTGGTGLHRLRHALSHSEGPHDAAGGAAVRHLRRGTALLIQGTVGAGRPHRKPHPCAGEPPGSRAAAVPENLVAGRPGGRRLSSAGARPPRPL